MGLAWDIGGGDWGEGEKVVSGCKGLKIVFSPLSVCPSLPLTISKIKVGEVAGKGPEDPEVISLWSNQGLHKAQSLRPGQWAGFPGVKGDPCLPPLSGPEGGKTPRTGALALWGHPCLLSESWPWGHCPNFAVLPSIAERRGRQRGEKSALKEGPYRLEGSEVLESLANLPPVKG